MKIAFDIDGVLADFGGAFNKIINLLYGKYTIPTDYQPKDWNWSDVLTPEMQKRGFEEIANTRNFWTTLGKFNDALASVADSLSVKNDIYLLTARANSAGGTIVNQTRSWLRNGTDRPAYRDYLGERIAQDCSIIAVANAKLKRQVLEGIGIETMIDDHGPTVEGFDQIPNFQGYLLDRPWNQDAKVKNRVATVREFCERIGCLKSKTPSQTLTVSHSVSPAQS